LSNKIKSPEFVRKIDWIDITSWDKNGYYYPVVQYYLITSGAGSFMDFHIDFGGSSVEDSLEIIEEKIEGKEGPLLPRL
jgi:hypothetical protein